MKIRMWSGQNVETHLFQITCLQKKCMVLILYAFLWFRHDEMTISWSGWNGLFQTILDLKYFWWIRSKTSKDTFQAKNIFDNYNGAPEISIFVKWAKNVIFRARVSPQRVRTTQPKVKYIKPTFCSQSSYDFSERSEVFRKTGSCDFRFTVSNFLVNPPPGYPRL